MAFVRELLCSLPKLNSVDATLVLRDMYDTKYGLYDHASAGNARPLASVEMRPSIDATHTELLETAVKSYVSNNIRTTYGLSLLEFLDLPQEVIKVLLKVVGEKTVKATAELAKVEQAFNQV